MLKQIPVFFLVLLPTIALTPAFAVNPIITDNYSADPSAHLFNGRMYVYGSRRSEMDARSLQCKPCVGCA